MKLAHHIMTWQGWNAKQNTPFDLDLALHEIKTTGYDGVELGGDEQSLGDPELIKEKLTNNGLQIAAWGASVTANPWPPSTEQFQRELDYAAALGVRLIAVCGGFLPEQRRTTFDSDYALFAENLGASCEYAQRHGQTIAFHPHCGCIVETIAEVRRLWHYLPNLHLCIDTGHLAAVGCDPIELLKVDPEKIAHVHLKDWHREQRHFAELGQGDVELNFARFLQTLETIKYGGWIVVERDDPPIPAIESARISRVFLQGIDQRAERASP